MPVINTALTLRDLPTAPNDKKGWPWTEQSKSLPERMSDGTEWSRISIITPSYNQGQFIEETIRSVLLQGYPNLEYIIIDGGSTDNTVDVIKKYERYITYWVSKPDQGQADAINKGIKQSTGEILGWVNSDDMYVKKSLAKVAQSFHSLPEVIVVHGNRILINKNSRVCGWSHLPAFNPRKGGYIVSSETAFWQRIGMEKIGLLNSNLKFAMDLEFFCRLFLEGKFLKLSDYLGYFRCHAESKSSKISHIGQDEAKKVWQQLFGSKNINWQKRPKYNLVRHNLTPIIHPKLIGLPYLSSRFLKK